MSLVEIGVVFVDLFEVMSRSRRSYVSISLIKSNEQNQVVYVIY